MSEQGDRIARRRVRTNQISTILSLSLVLFVIGVLGMVLLNARKVSTHVKENIGFNIFLKDSAGEAEIKALQKSLDASAFVKSSRFVTKEEAAEAFKKELGEDFVGFLGYNPLRPSIDIKLQADYANNDSLVVLETRLRGNPIVTEVFYQRSLVNLVNENVRKIGLFLLIFSILLAVIPVALINNTIRLYIYSRRFVIKTMQLVGATSGFIRKPFLRIALFNGIAGSLLSIAFLAALIGILEKNIPEFIELQDVDTFAFLFIFLFTLGISIPFLSTYFAVRKYLKLESEKLYQ
jgi:cell division transport system permease protein